MTSSIPGHKLVYTCPERLDKFNPLFPGMRKESGHSFGATLHMFFNKQVLVKKINGIIHHPHMGSF